MSDKDDQNGPGTVDPLDDVTSSVEGDAPPSPSPEQPGGPAPTTGLGSSSAAVPAVATGGTKNVIAIVFAAGAAMFLVFNLLFSGDDAPPPVDNTNKAQIERGVRGGVVPPPPEPPPPPIPAPPPPPPPPPPPNLVQTLQGGSEPINTNESIKKGLTIPPERRKAAIVVGGGGGLISGVSLEGGAEGGVAEGDLEDTTAPQVDATIAGEPINMVAQGKIISAVLETAINSELSGILRAVVSRDVYAEAGKRVLIPKGSRLVGSYDIQVRRGQSRVFIIWNRVIRPDGIDVVITSPGSDRLGRAGVEGAVDNKYVEVFSNAILFSTLTIGFAFAAESAIDAQGLSERENTSGSVTTTGNPSDIAVVEAIDDFGDVVKNIAQEVVDLRPTIVVDQGTIMKVFVNKDLKFPSVIKSNVVFIK